MANQAWGQLGMQVAGNTANTAMGMLAQRIGANYDRKQQLKTQEAMMKLQYPWQLRMMEDQKRLDLDMWKQTGIVGQMEQLELAGMNPGLLYGGKGGGGQTVGGTATMNAPPAGVISTGNPQGLGMTPITGAQIRLMEAQARNLDVNSDKTAGVDTANVQADTLVKNQTIENLKQDVKSEQAKQRLTEIQTKLDNYEANFLEQTMDDRIKTIHANYNAALGLAKSAEAQGEISHQTYLDVIDGIRIDVINKAIEGALMDAQKGKTNQDVEESKQRIKQSEAQINQISEQIMQDWHGVWNEQQRNEIMEKLGLLGVGVTGARTIYDMLNSLDMRKGPAPVRGFGKPGKRY